MKIKNIQMVAAMLACAGMVTPTALLAEQPVAVQTEPRPELADVALQQGGLLVGSVVDQQGVAQPGTEVAVQYRDAEIARTVTDENGVFAVQGLRGGQYRIATNQGVTGVRAWSPETAPPSALQAARVVQGDQLVRGNFMGMSTGTLLGVGVAITAIGVGVGVAIANDDDHS
jgi:hypothetical protein